MRLWTSKNSRHFCGAGASDSNLKTWAFRPALDGELRVCAVKKLLCSRTFRLSITYDLSRVALPAPLLKCSRGSRLRFG